MSRVRSDCWADPTFVRGRKWACCEPAIPGFSRAALTKWPNAASN